MMIKINKIVPVTRKAYDPNDNFLGDLNVFEFNDLRIQISKERVSGYYVTFEDRIINIKPDGSTDAWPNEFFDQYEYQLRELLKFRFDHTSEHWQKLYPSPQVLDPDGWDRENFQFSWHEENISFHEYQRRVSLSTCMHKKE